MRKVNSKTLALLHDHATRLSEGISPVLITELADGPGLLTEIIQDTQHDFFEDVLKHNFFWATLPHAGLVRVDQILPNGIICCFSQPQVVSNTTASAMAGSNDRELWLLDGKENAMIDSITQWHFFERYGLTFKPAGGNLELSLCDPAEPDQLWLQLVLEKQSLHDKSVYGYVIRWADILNHQRRNNEPYMSTNDITTDYLNALLFDNCGILNVSRAKVIRVYTTVEVSAYKPDPSTV